MKSARCCSILGLLVSLFLSNTAHAVGPSQSGQDTDPSKSKQDAGPSPTEKTTPSPTEGTAGGSQGAQNAIPSKSINAGVNIESYYSVDYTFVDPWEKPRSLNLKYPVKKTNDMIARFGIPRWMTEGPSSPRDKAEQANGKRSEIVKAGLFIYHPGKLLGPDPSAVVSYYAPDFCSQIAQKLKKMLVDDGKDSRENRIEIALRFVQDIPYAVPADAENDAKRIRSGVLTPPEVLLSCYGDCDSKSFLLAGILAYLIDPGDVRFFETDTHMTMAVRMPSGDKAAYSEMVGEGENSHVEHYWIAEPSGARLKVGDRGSFAAKKVSVSHLIFDEKYAQSLDGAH